MNKYFLYLIAAIFVLLPISAVRPMTSLFADSLGASVTEIGILTACYSLTPLLLSVNIGRLVDLIGERIPILLGASGLILALVIPYFFPNLTTLYASQLLLGGSQFLTLVALQNGLTKSVSSQKRDSAIATFSLFVSSGMMLGPLIGGYSSEHIGFKASYLLFFIITIGLIIVGIFIKSTVNSKEITKKERRVKDVITIPGMKNIFLISMLNLAVLDIFYVFFPLYANSIGISPSEIGWILTIQSFASIITRLYLPMLVHHYGKVKVLRFFMFLGAIAYGSMSFITGFISIAAVSAIFGIGLGIVQPLTIMITVYLAPEERMGESLAIRIAGNRLSQTITPLFISGISAIMGLGYIFIFSALPLTLCAIMSKKINAE
ncbi:MFS transporter [Halobacillus sp. A5]|uniref:MFS transporter n=1 Tax=Halobacillus sp. A5 TaxID=2880263 RepID=UPI0020A64A89|nr:MFS transporter [Halobacillus sp. A5]MCP3028343.1 MFS transporter [Halobacillus sp. A5]